MLSQQKTKTVISSDDEDDYELPSLSERIKAFQNKNVSHHASSESGDEDSGFLKFSERIRSNPCSQSKFNEKEISHKKTEELNTVKNVRKNDLPSLNMKLDFSSTSDSEDDEADFLNFSQRIHSTPQVKILDSCDIISESDSDDEIFSNLSKRFNLLTPRTENKENCNTVVGCDAKKLSEFRTPLPLKKKVSDETVDSDSDESVLKFVEILRTPMSVNKTFSQKAIDSESDESFSSFVEKIRTPLSVNRNTQHKVIESDSDDSFLNNSRKLSFKTPQSQRKSQKEVVSVPKILQVKQCKSSLVVQDTPNTKKRKSSQIENEFEELFHPESIHSTFMQKRESYTRKLYEFYNKKVFTSQLPPNMPVFYNGALKTTAGITYCSMKDNTYTCSIKLSSSLLISFDRLKATLLHEMCHAAVWIINKQRRVRHGPLWQIWASRCKLILPFIECPTRCHNYEISYRVWYQCPKCQWKKGRCKQVRKYHGALCKTCKSPIVMTYS